MIAIFSAEVYLNRKTCQFEKAIPTFILFTAINRVFNSQNGKYLPDLVKCNFER